MAWQIIAGSDGERLATGTTRVRLQLEPSDRLDCGLDILSHFKITALCKPIKTFAQVGVHNGKSKGDERINQKINHKPQTDYHLFS